MQFHRNIIVWFLASYLALVAPTCAGLRAADETPSANPPRAVLHLAGDAFVTGELRASDGGKTLRWQSPSFTQPFDFALDAVKGVHNPVASESPKPQGDYRFELTGGDVLFGSLVRLADDEAELEAPRFGTLRLRRDHIRTIDRLNAAEFLYHGPHGISGWKEPDGAKEWSEEAGQLVTDRPGATLFGDLAIPTKAAIECELSWKNKPDFTFAIGVGENGRATDRPFRFEVSWRPLTAAPVLLADARHGESIKWQYTTSDPGPRWFEPDFQASKWRVGPAGFGTEGTPGSIVRTNWDTAEIWLRRRFELASQPKSVALWVHHDEDVRVWINGQLVFEQDGFRSGYILVPLDRAAKVLRKGENMIAVHCRQSGGGQYIDVGLIDQSTAATGELIAVRESEREADLAPVQNVGFGGGRMRLVAFLDQELGRLLVVTPEGNTVADLKVATNKPQALGGVLLTNHSGDVRLERLRISRWSGLSSRELQTNKPHLRRTDGSIAYGQLVGVDADAKQFIIRDGKEETRVAADQVAGVVMSPASPGAPGSPRTLRAVYQDGTQLSGELNHVAEGRLQLSSPGFREPLRLPLAGIRSLVVLKQANSPAAPLSDGPTGTLEVDGLHLPGRLTKGQENAQASCLVWQPDYSLSDSPLRLGVTGQITYRDPPPPPRPKIPRRQRAEGIAAQFTRLFSGDNSETADGQVSPDGSSPTTGRRSLHLRSGDTVPCEVTRIDQDGVYFKTPNSDSTFVPHQKVKAVELVSVDGPPKLNKAKRTRLLMLPRVQTDSPPTHLIRSKNGDFLRGRLIAMDDARIRVEVQLQNKEIQRDRVTHIIWLHADELTDSAAGKSGPPPTAAATRVQARTSDGNRLTFSPKQLAGKILSGTSDVLGACRADLTQVDQVLIGAAIDRAVADLPYATWKLHRALVPKFVLANEGKKPSDQAPETDPGLVGKPAPDFELALLDGRKFQLARSKGKVVILDFWATWCGPCLQLMPQIDRVVRQFEGQNVELVAVNLEEPASIITSTLERHKLQMAVALDRDGVVAAKYKAVAIPQTVVIDRDGKVARVFVGGGSQVVEQLRDAVRDLLAAGEK